MPASAWFGVADRLREKGQDVVKIASAYKIAYHGEKIESYLNGDPVFPATLELDITSECTRACGDCPSARGASSMYLSMDFIRDLFACLEGRTRGLLLTGGEATMAPGFPSVLRMARRAGFADIAVVTNGMLLHEDRVAASLLADASTIRISMYDWSGGSCGGMEPTLRQIEGLRARIDRERSGLQLGVSALTSSDRATALDRVTEAVHSAGAHWIYFHPLCTGWGTGSPVREAQDGVMESVSRCRELEDEGFRVFISRQRYVESKLEFGAYHAAHFLLVIGADGLNYLGAEVKYHPKLAIADVAGDWGSDFLSRRERLERISSIDSRNYSAMGSRHRGVLYSDFIERLRCGEDLPARQGEAASPGNGFCFPHIL